MHPYRTPPEPDDANQATPTSGIGDAFENRLVELVLLTVGALGIIIGLTRPPSTLELTIGSFLVLLVVHGWLPKGGSSRRRRKGSDP